MSWPLVVVAVLAAAVVLMRTFAARIYDAVIIHMTERWYACFIAEMPHGASVLDVGIGTATALVRNKAAAAAKALRFTGVDYERAYVEQARSGLAAAGMSDVASVVHGSIYEAKALLPKGYKCDAVYFSGSFSLMPDPPAALRVVAETLRDRETGRIYITQVSVAGVAGAMMQVVQRGWWCQKHCIRDPRPQTQTQQTQTQPQPQPLLCHTDCREHMSSDVSLRHELHYITNIRLIISYYNTFRVLT